MKLAARIISTVLVASTGILTLAIASSAQTASEWSLIYPDPGDVVPTGQDEFNDVEFFDKTTGMVCTHNGVLRTTDAGENWTYTELVTDKVGPHYLKAIGIVDENTAYVVGDEGRKYVTTDAGVSWVEKRDDACYHYKCAFFLDEKTGWLAGDSSCSGSITEGKACVWFTSDGGASWTLRGTFDEKVPITGFFHSILNINFTNDRIGYMTGSYGLVAFSEDGGASWTQIKPQIGRHYYALAVRRKGHLFIGSDFSECYQTTNGGTEWIEPTMPNGISVYYDMLFTDDANGICVGRGPVPALQTNDNGQTWTSDSIPEFEGWRTLRSVCYSGQHYYTVSEEGQIYRKEYSSTSEVAPVKMSDELLLDVYPNVVSQGQQVHVDKRHEHAVNICIRMYDIHGRLAAELSRNDFDVGTRNSIIDTGNLSCGVYFIRAIAMGRMKVFKIVIQ